MAGFPNGWFMPFVFIGVVLPRLDPVNGGNLSFASSVTRIPRDLYHTSGSLLEEIYELVGRHPDKLTMELLNAANKGYRAEVPVVTYSHAKKKGGNDLQYRILLSFGQHGRELITTEVALHLLSILSEEHSLHKMVGTDPTSLEKALDNTVIKIVPMENVMGRKLVEAGDFCERRNGRGVDLNRNWSVDWGKKEKALFMPYDHKNTTPEGLTSQLMKSMLEDVNHHHFEGRCLVGSGGGSVGYFAHGTTTDYMHEIAKVPMAFTFEIYGDQSASSKDCFKMFNPVDAATFQRVVDDWCGAFLTIFKTSPELLRSASMTRGRWISIGGDSVEGLLLERNGGGKGKKTDGLEFGMSEMRTYFRLFILSCFFLMFMFCSRITKSKCRHGSLHA